MTQINLKYLNFYLFLSFTFCTALSSSSENVSCPRHSWNKQISRTWLKEGQIDDRLETEPRQRTSRTTQRIWRLVMRTNPKSDTNVTTDKRIVTAARCLVDVYMAGSTIDGSCKFVFKLHHRIAYIHTRVVHVLAVKKIDFIQKLMLIIFVTGFGSDESNIFYVHRPPSEVQLRIIFIYVKLN